MAAKNPAAAEVYLVMPPLSDVRMPSIALSILQATLLPRGISCTIDYANLEFAQLCGWENYIRLQHGLQRHMLGEFVFAAAAGLPTKQPAEAFIDWLAREFEAGRGGLISRGRKMAKKELAELLGFYQRQALTAVEECVARILRANPAIVGISSMFQQNNAAIAILRRLKACRPEIITMLGGANCMHTAGLAMLREMEWTDVVFFGEADEIFADVCAAALRGGPLPDAYGVVKRGDAPPNPPPHRITADLNRLPYPRYEDFLRAVAALPIGRKFSPILLIEGSRGCWWGEKNPCTFCGLNGAAHTYRAKTTPRLAAELNDLRDMYGIGLFFFTDSILSRAHTAELPRRLMRQKKKFRLFCEIKSNLTPPEIENLAQSGFIELQPGIESLQDDILRLMRKGSRAIRQIQVLKEIHEQGMRPIWNLLCGFPGEPIAAYRELLAIIPYLTHLPAPNSLLHIAFHKHSVYVNEPAKYGLELKTAEIYDFVAWDRPGFVRDTAYLYEPTDAKERASYYDCRLKHPLYDAIFQAVQDWRNRYKAAPDRLDLICGDDYLEIYDLRAAADALYYRLTGVERAIYLCCRRASTEQALRRRLEGQYPLAAIQSGLARLCAAKLLLSSGGSYLALAIEMQKEKNHGEKTGSLDSAGF